MTNISIKGRLYGGFGLLVTFGVMLASFGIWQLWGIQVQVDLMDLQSNNNILALEIGSELQAARRDLQHYIFAQDETSFIDADRRLDKARTLLLAAMEKTTSDECRAWLKDILKDVEKIKTSRGSLGEAIQHMQAARATQATQADKVVASLQKFIAAAGETPVARDALLLESRIYPVRMTTLRFLSVKDPKLVELFHGNLDKVGQHIAALEQAALPSDLAALLAVIKTSLVSYAAGFDQVAASLLLADQLYDGSVTPLTVHAAELIDKVTVSISATFKQVVAASHEVIGGTISVQKILGGVAAGFGLLVAFLIARGLVGPLAELVRDAGLLSGGDTSAAFRTAQRADEIGKVAGAVAKFRDNVIAQQQAAESFAAEVAARETTNRNMENAVEGFRLSADAMLATVGENAGTMKQTATTLATISSEATSQADSAAAVADQTASNVQTVAAAAEQLTSSIQEIGRQIERSNSTVRTAGAATARSETEIQGLAEAAQSISSVVDLIHAIAAQTNLLALNATIEAARAGEAGRGFAVVAQEVKSLAEQTAKATQEIGQHITGIQAATGSAVSSVKEVGVAMRQIDEVSTAIANAVQQQGAATREISQNVQMAASGSRTLASSIATVNDAIVQTNRSADQVLASAGEVAGAAERLAREVQAFFVTLRSGPMDRRREEDPTYSGPNRRGDARQRRAGRGLDRKAG